MLVPFFLFVFVALCVICLSQTAVAAALSSRFGVCHGVESLSLMSSWYGMVRYASVLVSVAGGTRSKLEFDV